VLKGVNIVVQEYIKIVSCTVKNKE